jgi:hypothetical protein
MWVPDLTADAAVYESDYKIVMDCGGYKRIDEDAK